MSAVVSCTAVCRMGIRRIRTGSEASSQKDLVLDNFCSMCGYIFHIEKLYSFAHASCFNRLKKQHLPINLYTSAGVFLFSPDFFAFLQNFFLKPLAISGDMIYNKKCAVEIIVYFIDVTNFLNRRELP